MFTGIIESLGTITAAEPRGDLRLTIACDFAGELRVGESVACNGACMTVVAHDKAGFTLDISAESVARTAPGQWETGKRVNLERAMKLGDRLDGHMVSGHVDGIARVHAIAPIGDSHEMSFDAPKELSRFIAEKGSVTLDGISLTVNKVEAGRFRINIIPYTWRATTLGERQPGDSVNLEIDLIARYVAQLLPK